MEAIRTLLLVLGLFCLASGKPLRSLGSDVIDNDNITENQTASSAHMGTPLVKESAIASVAANESYPPLSEADLKQSIAQPVANEVTSPPKVSPATIEMLKKVKVWCINLAKRPDRWAFTQELLQLRGVPEVHRYEAVDGDLIDTDNPELLTARARWEMDKPRENDVQIGSRGAIGCFLSHLALWNVMIQKNISVALIFEDDVDIGLDFYEQLGALWEKIEMQGQFTKRSEHLHGILLGWERMIDPPVATDTPGLSRLRGRFWGTQGYLITKEGAIAMRQRALPLNMQVDAHMAIETYLRPDVHWYVPQATLAAQQKMKGSNVWVACPGCVGEGGYLISWYKVAMWIMLTIALAGLAWHNTLKAWLQRFAFGKDSNKAPAMTN